MIRALIRRAKQSPMAIISTGRNTKKQQLVNIEKKKKKDGKKHESRKKGEE